MRKKTHNKNRKDAKHINCKADELVSNHSSSAFLILLKHLVKTLYHIAYNFIASARCYACKQSVYVFFKFFGQDFAASFAKRHKALFTGVCKLVESKDNIKLACEKFRYSVVNAYKVAS